MNKHISCMLCHGEEKAHFGSRKKSYKPGKEVAAILCSDCTQQLSRLTQGQAAKAYRLAKQNGYPDKARCLEMFFDIETEELKNDSKTRKNRPGIVREKIMRLARPTNYRFRA